MRVDALLRGLAVAEALRSPWGRRFTTDVERVLFALVANPGMTATVYAGGIERGRQQFSARLAEHPGGRRFESG